MMRMWKKAFFFSMLILVSLNSHASHTQAHAQANWPYSYLSEKTNVPVHGIDAWLPDITYTMILDDVKSGGILSKIYCGSYMNQEKEIIYLISQQAYAYTIPGTLKINASALTEATKKKAEIIKAIEALREYLHGTKYTIIPATYLYTELLLVMNKVDEYFATPEVLLGQLPPPIPNPMDFSSAAIYDEQNRVEIGIFNMTDEKTAWFKKSIIDSPVVYYVNVDPNTCRHD